MLIADIIPLRPVEKMLKLSVLTRNFLNYLLSTSTLVSPVKFYFRLLSAVLLIHSASLLYQLNDLSLLDQPVNLSLVSPISRILNIFNYISYDHAFFVLLLLLLFSSLLFFLILPFWSLLIITLLNVSMLYLFPTFLSFQWDIFLIELCVCSLFLTNPKHVKYKTGSILFVQILPILLLVIRLFINSGLVKLLSNDLYWFSLSALDFHFYSQPLPHLLSYFFHQIIVKYNLSFFLTYMMFVFELVIPLGLFFKSYRKISAFLLILFQITIIFTGNFGYFNFIVIVPLILLFLINFNHSDHNLKLPYTYYFVGLVLFAFVVNSSFRIVNFKSNLPIFNSFFNQTMLFRNYGLFARMTTNQTKFSIFLSNDQEQWRAIDLKYYDKDGFPTLGFNQPYMPRIRWQLWFKFLMPPEAIPPWYTQFLTEIASSNHSLNSILDTEFPRIDYRYVKVCYQNIVFNLNDNDDHPYWRKQSFPVCDLFDFQKSLK